MIDSIFIKNFRIFKSLRIEQLGRLNLIVGKNNSGKSCFLEAMWVYRSNPLAIPNIFWNLVSQRNELWERAIKKNEDIPYNFEHPFRYLFNGYRLPYSNDDQIKIGLLKDDGESNISITLKSNVLDIKKNKINFGISLDKATGDIGQMFGRFPRNTKFLNIEMVSSKGISDERVSLLWDKINLTDIQDEIINGIRLIDPNIKGIALFNMQDPERHRIPIVRLEQSSERIPLRSMGDGMTCIFHLILALVNSKDGTLLIDEFENGLHWSVLPKVWDTIFRLAEKLNVQVFATTHSRDCILGFRKAWEKNQSLGSFHRLDVDKEYGAKSITYSLETLSDALDMDVEVR